MTALVRIAGLSLLLLLSAGVYYAVTSHNAPTHSDTIKAMSSATTSETQYLLESITLPQAQEQSISARVEEPSVKQTVQKGKIPPRLMQPADIGLDVVEAEFAHIGRDQLLDGREFVRFNSRPLRLFKTGQPFSVALPFEEQVFTGVVRKVSEFQEMKRLTGKFIDSGNEQINHFSMTVSGDGRYVAGSISIDEETYTLEAKNGIGWVNKSSNVNEYLVRSEQEHTINFAPHLMGR